ncbi:hypothetical protein VYU27_004797 [Nannochloropsis oceanica]
MAMGERVTRAMTTDEEEKEEEEETEKGDEVEEEGEEEGGELKDGKGSKRKEHEDEESWSGPRLKKEGREQKAFSLSRSRAMGIRTEHDSASSGSNTDSDNIRTTNHSSAIGISTEAAATTGSPCRRPQKQKMALADLSHSYNNSRSISTSDNSGKMIEKMRRRMGFEKEREKGEMDAEGRIPRYRRYLQYSDEETDRIARIMMGKSRLSLSSASAAFSASGGSRAFASSYYSSRG